MHAPTPTRAARGSPRTIAGDHGHDRVSRLLADAAAARQAQLDALPPAGDDLVAAAHRASVQRILDTIDLAREQLRTGTYGTCRGCGGRVDEELLRLRPWTTTCPTCAGR